MARDILKEYEPEVVRMFLLSSQYRKTIDFSREKFEEMLTARKRLANAVDLAVEKLGWRTEEREENLIDAIDDTPGEYVDEAEKILAGFIKQMSNDFNTQGGSASMFEMANFMNRLAAEFDESKRTGLNWALLKMMRMADVMGILQDKWHKIYFLEDAPAASDDSGKQEVVENLCRILVELRNRARDAKDFEAADLIRDRLTALGIEVKDTPEGTKLSWE